MCKSQSKGVIIRNYISEKPVFTQCLLPICNVEFNLWKVHFRVTGINSVITKLGN